jgi:hypothetical protein
MKCKLIHIRLHAVGIKTLADSYKSIKIMIIFTIIRRILMFMMMLMITTIKNLCTLY